MTAFLPSGTLKQTVLDFRIFTINLGCTVHSYSVRLIVIALILSGYGCVRGGVERKPDPRKQNKGGIRERENVDVKTSLSSAVTE